MSDPDFAQALCGYREDSGHPSTSDKSDNTSIRWGNAMFDALGVHPDAPAAEGVGTLLEEAVVHELRAHRPDLVIERSRLATQFDQYRHLDHMRTYTTSFKDDLNRIEQAVVHAKGLDTSPPVTALRRQLSTLRKHAKTNQELFQALKDNLAEESMLRLDIAVTSPKSGARLQIGLSSKWSLRTDRAQDCVSQGAKLVAQRRGHMPHYAVVTMEPRPSMLRLIADGSGSVDCVYHVAYEALLAAASTMSDDSDARTRAQVGYLDRMVKQNRIRSWTALVDELLLLP